MRLMYKLALPPCLLAVGCSGTPDPAPANPPQVATEDAAHKPAPTKPAPPKKKRPKPASPVPAGSCALPGFQLLATAYSPYQAGKEAAPLEKATCWTETLLAQIQGATTRAKQGAMLDFDPLVDAQDHKLTDFRMKPVDDDTWAVRFTNLGQPKVVTWELVEEPGAPGNYRVGDIHTDKWRLTELLAP